VLLAISVGSGSAVGVSAAVGTAVDVCVGSCVAVFIVVAVMVDSGVAVGGTDVFVVAGEAVGVGAVGVAVSSGCTTSPLAKSDPSAFTMASTCAVAPILG
jgi:hypothetical protein